MKAISANDLGYGHVRRKLTPRRGGLKRLAGFTGLPAVAGGGGAPSRRNSTVGLALGASTVRLVDHEIAFEIEAPAM